MPASPIPAGGGAIVGALGKAGPWVAVAAAVVTAVTAAVAAFKRVTEAVIAFGRSLTKVSASMAQVFAAFDVQMMQFQRQLGEALAPAFRELLFQITEIVKIALPAFTLGMQVLVGVITEVLAELKQFFEAIKIGARIQADAFDMLANPLNAKNDLNDIKAAMQEWFNWQKQQAAKKNDHPGTVKAYMDMLNAKDSRQRQYQSTHQWQAPVNGDNVGMAGQAIGAGAANLVSPVPIPMPNGF